VAFANRDDGYHDWAVRLATQITEPLTCEAVLAVAKRYADRHADLADICLVRMSELYPRHSVITSIGRISGSTGAASARRFRSSVRQIDEPASDQSSARQPNQDFFQLNELASGLPAI